MRQLGAAGPDRPVPTNNRYTVLESEASIRSSEEQDQSRHHLAHRGGLEICCGVEHCACGRRATGGCTVCVGRPSVVWLCGLYGWSQYAPRWL
jgi:hypothetical protein